MIEIKRYLTAKDYLTENLKYLEKEESTNSLIIGIASSKKGIDEDDTIYISAIKENEIIFTGIKTLKGKLLITGELEELKLFGEPLQNYLNRSEIKIPGLIGEKELSFGLIDIWKEKENFEIEVRMKQFLYQINEVQYNPEKEGNIRLATPSDYTLIKIWFREFLDEVFQEIDSKDGEKLAKMKLANKEIYIWVDKTEKSMACIARPTRNGISINYVYTPKGERKKGYGQKLVSELTLKMLRQYKFCTLFTDIDNPISNKIYSKIGYEKQQEFRDISIIKAGL